MLLIATDEAGYGPNLGPLVVTQIQPVEGIVRTLTCPVIKL